MKQQVSVGKVSDSMEKLEQLCQEKAEKMAKTMTGNAEVSFWTADIPELICVAEFNKGEVANVPTSSIFHNQHCKIL